MYRNTTIKRWMKENNGKLFSNSFPGGYTIIYIDGKNNVYCSNCAAKIAPEIAEVTTYDEGPNLYCEDCGIEIESSYGDPEESHD